MYAAHGWTDQQLFTTILKSLLTKGGSFLGGHPRIRQTGRLIQRTTTLAKAKQRAIRQPLFANHCIAEVMDKGSRSRNRIQV